MKQSEVIIDLSALADNYKAYQKHYPDHTLVPVIKNDAYGHCAQKTARLLEDAGCRTLAVFNIDEAEDVRKSGYSGELWSLEGALPEEAEQAAGLNVTLALWNFDTAKALSNYAVAHGIRFTCHLKIDTGMSRLGFLAEDIPAVWPKLSMLPGLDIIGCFSHLAVAETPDSPLSLRQVQAWKNALAVLPPSVHQRHLCATGGTLGQMAHETTTHCRLGIGLYGCMPDDSMDDIIGLRQAMSFKSRVISVKEVPAGRTVSYGGTYELPATTRLAVIPVGYADAFPRALSNKADVLIRGVRRPIRGRVCMGMFMVEVSNDVQIGDEVVLLGRQGHECIKMEEWAAKTGTITYELFCLLGRHPNRLIHNS